ncbi:DDE-type integrase/transposase/recombinase, partial [Sedimentitalea sp.]|uniref:DDE-type integrase/transposase/recombinase n=1 Tax=Sedimentitalea sp. TaxID=2048915 RepID=UPI003298E863
IITERGVDLDHATLNRWVERYAGAVAGVAHRRKEPTGQSRRMGETYGNVKGEWTYLNRAIGKQRNTLDFMLSERREAAATALFMKAIGNNGWPDKVVIDKSGSNTVGLFNMNCLLVMCGWYWLITVRRMKYLHHCTAG